MNPPKCDLSLYTHFLLVSQQRFSCTELARVAPEPTSHDAASRFLREEDFSPKDLWRHVKQHVREGGVIIFDDTVFPKPSSRACPLLHYLWDNVDKKIVRGIGLTTLLWTSTAEERLPLDYRVYAKKLDGKSKNDHLREMARTAKQRGLNPSHVLIDTWYANVKNLAHLRGLGYHWIGQFKANRVVFYRRQRLHLRDLPACEDTWQVHLPDYGTITVYRVTRADASIVYLGTDNLTLSKEAAQTLFRLRWRVEEYHQGLKQQAAAGKCAASSATSQRNHLFSALRTLIGLERYRLATGVPYPEAKHELLRDAITDRLRQHHPLYELLP